MRWTGLASRDLRDGHVPRSWTSVMTTSDVGTRWEVACETSILTIDTMSYPCRPRPVGRLEVQDTSEGCNFHHNPGEHGEAPWCSVVTCSGDGMHLSPRTMLARPTAKHKSTTRPHTPNIRGSLSSSTTTKRTYNSSPLPPWTSPSPPPAMTTTADAPDTSRPPKQTPQATQTPRNHPLSPS